MAVKNNDGDVRFLYREAGFAALSAYLQLGLEPDQLVDDSLQGTRAGIGCLFDSAQMRDLHRLNDAILKVPEILTS